MSRDSKIRVGLALGSGAARGWAHIGALVGGFHVTGFLSELEEWARKLTKLRMVRYLDFRVASNGMIAGNRLFAEMERRVGDMCFEDLSRPFAVIATDLYTGHEVWYSEGEMVPAIRASFSLPGLFEPTRVDGAGLSTVHWSTRCRFRCATRSAPKSSSPSTSTRRPTETAGVFPCLSAQAGSTRCPVGPTGFCAKARAV